MVNQWASFTLAGLANWQISQILGRSIMVWRIGHRTGVNVETLYYQDHMFLSK